MLQEQQRRVTVISQATIQVRSADGADIFDDLRRLFLDWLTEKAGANLPEQMRLGHTAEFNALGAQRVETVGLDEPRYWASRQDDQDPNFPRRTWITEIALARYKDLGFLVGFRLHCVTLGEVAPFSRSIPRFMRTVTEKFDTYLDDAEISLFARHADTREEVDKLIHLLVSPQRAHPVIGISCEANLYNGRRWIIDPNRLAKDVFSVAHVWAIGSEASVELSKSLGRDLSVFHGGVRSWRFPFTLEDNPYSHPLVIGRHLINWDDRGPIAFHHQLVQSLLRTSAVKVDAERSLPSFAEVRQLASRITREKAFDEGKSEKELLELALSENARLTREIKEQKAEYTEIFQISQVEFESTQAELDEARAEVRNHQHRVGALEKALRDQRQQEIQVFPETLAEMGSWAVNNLNEGVKILPRAINAAKKSAFEDVAFVYSVLCVFRDKYVPMRRSGNSQLKSECDLAWQELGIVVTPSFSGPGAGQFGDDYKVKFNGSVRVLDMHLKGSNSRDPRYGFRCYFFWDENDKSVVIGSIPGHLSTSIT